MLSTWHLIFGIIAIQTDKGKVGIGNPVSFQALPRKIAGYRVIETQFLP